MSRNDRKPYFGVERAQIEELIGGSGNCIVLNGQMRDENRPTTKSFKFSRLIGIGISEAFSGSGFEDLLALKEWLSSREDYVLGYFSYDLKNALESVNSSNADVISFSPFYFFVPETLIIEQEGAIEVLSHNLYLNLKPSVQSKKASINSELDTISKDQYIKTVNELKGHIQHGDIYEVNYCVQHSYANSVIEPYRLFKELQKTSPAPFSCYIALDGNYLMSSSPERFMRKDGERLVSQPMKGTNRKVQKNNANQKALLAADTKERAENVMITDLVRNDLSRSAKQGTVKVEELCGVYEFEHVNQMISTVSAELKQDLHPLDALLNAFPMGSMTGAPKIRAMELIDQYEDFSRGLYSGSVGFFTPDLDFDFNVVIRSILYNSSDKVLTFPTGSAITINSDAQKEYEECMLKAEAMKKVILNHA